MLTLRRSRVPKPTAGRPPRDEGDRGTRQIRVFEDLGEMISWIIRVEGGTTANLLDPMIRAQILARYTKHQDVIAKLKAAEEAVRRVEEETLPRRKRRD